MGTVRLSNSEQQIINKALELFLSTRAGSSLTENVYTIFEKLRTKGLRTMTDSEQIEETQRLTKLIQTDTEDLEASNKELEAQIEADQEFTEIGQAFADKHPRLWVVINAYYRTKYFLRKLCRGDK